MAFCAHMGTPCSQLCTETSLPCWAPGSHNILDLSTIHQFTAATHLASLLCPLLVLALGPPSSSLSLCRAWPSPFDLVIHQWHNLAPPHITRSPSLPHYPCLPPIAAGQSFVLVRAEIHRLEKEQEGLLKELQLAESRANQLRERAQAGSLRAMLQHKDQTQEQVAQERRTLACLDLEVPAGLGEGARMPGFYPGYGGGWGKGHEVWWVRGVGLGAGTPGFYPSSGWELGSSG